MLAQPKALVVVEGSVPRLEWWAGVDAWLGEVTDGAAPHAVGDVVLSGRVEVVLRACGEQPALVVGCDGKELWVTGPDGVRLGETVLAEPATALRILTVGEYVEVYADGVFALTTLCYSGRAVPWTAVTGGEVRTVPVRAVRLPDPGRDDASAVWPGVSAS